MKKIILVLLIILVGYGLTIFLAPQISSTIDKFIGLDGFSESIRWGKEALDGAITDIPSFDEVIDWYETALSWAKDVKNTLSDGVETTKETIDTIRWWAQKAEDTYNEAKETIDSAKQTFDDLSWKVQEISEVVESVNSLTGTE